MVNFNTNQTRNLYVAKQVNAKVALNQSAAGVAGGAVAGDICLGSLATGEKYFSYKNGDGKIVRSDIFNPANITNLKLTSAAAMDTALLARSITVTPVSDWVGKSLNLVITANEFISFDANDSVSIVAQVIGDSTNTASAAAFYKALAKAIAKAMPKIDFPYFKLYMDKNGTATEITPASPDSAYISDATSIIIAQAPQDFKLGKVSNDPLGISISSSVRSSNVNEEPWAVVSDLAAAPGGAVISGSYKIAELEYFTMGERGDDKRGSTWPNDYTPTYLADVTKRYNVLTVEFFWAGDAEHVQKSPRMIQIAGEITGSGSAATDPATELYNSLTSTGSGSGA